MHAGIPVRGGDQLLQEDHHRQGHLQEGGQHCHVPFCFAPHSSTVPPYAKHQRNMSAPSFSALDLTHALSLLAQTTTVISRSCGASMNEGQALTRLLCAALQFSQVWVNATDELSQEEAVMEAIYTKGPMTVSVNAEGEDWRFYKSGVYNNTRCSPKLKALDHAVVVSGWVQFPQAHVSPARGLLTFSPVFLTPKYLPLRFLVRSSLGVLDFCPRAVLQGLLAWCMLLSLFLPFGSMEGIKSQV